jgi:RNA polymerase sigma-70 factor (ECF subfamily)
MLPMNKTLSVCCHTTAASGVMYHQYHGVVEERSLENQQSLNQFFSGAERRAFRMAQLATGNDDVALDIVQDAMLALARKYAGKPASEWGPLFHRIMQSKIRDWYRRSSVRNRVMSWLHIDDDETDPIQQLPDTQSPSPEAHLTASDSMRSTMQAVGALPLRQQQCFLLRAWEGYSVKDTAQIMACTEGSVKTHYSRAVKALQNSLQESNDDKR